MLGMLSVVSVVLGGSVAYYADRFPAHVEAMETCAGALLIGGLALVGSALPSLL